MDFYDPTVAAAYAAYRPPLHASILRALLPVGFHVTQAVDIGCGAGHSAHALLPFADRITAADPHSHMIASVPRHPSLTALVADEVPPDLPDASIDLISFAGSLFHADSSRLRTELRRIASPGARVIIYDFELDFGDWPDRLGCVSTWVGPPYDHEARLDLPVEVERNGVLAFTCTPEEWVKLLLALPLRCPLSESGIANRLRATSDTGRIRLDAKWWGIRSVLVNP